MDSKLVKAIVRAIERLTPLQKMIATLLFVFTVIASNADKISTLIETLR